MRRMPVLEETGSARAPIGCTPSTERLRVPAEWEPHESTWLQWPKGRERSLEPTFVEIVRALLRHERVDVIVSNERVFESAHRALGKGGALVPDVRFHMSPTDWCWCRDNGPMFLSDRGQLHVIDWGFNAWGDPRYRHANDDHVPVHVAASLGIPVQTSPVVIEGGALEWNGAGTVIASESCLLHRNPGLGRSDLEAILHDALGFDEVIWLTDYASADALTRGHPDAIARFIAADTVVVGEIVSVSDRDRAVYEKAAQILSGHGLCVRRMPIPGYTQGAAANYLNWYVANGVVIVGTFGVDEWDQAALRALAAYFPGRSAVGVFARSLWQEGGGIHCVTQQQPQISPVEQGGELGYPV